MDLTACLKAMGDPTRFTIFQQLLIRKHCTRSLSKKLGITEAAISQHLKILWETGMVYKNMDIICTICRHRKLLIFLIPLLKKCDRLLWR